MKFLLVLATLFALGFAVLLPDCSTGDEGWVISRFDADIAVARDSELTVTETIAVDFRDLERHGIFRDIPFAYALPNDDDEVRLTDIIVRTVTDEAGNPLQFVPLQSGAYERIRIGDPDVLVSGPQTYVIRYSVLGAVNPFTEHGELTWNVTGDQWPVPIESSSARITIESGTISSAGCAQGEAGSTEPCAESNRSGASASFRAGRTLEPGEGWTAAVAFPAGSIDVPPLMYGPRPSDPSEPINVAIKPVYLLVTLLVILGAIVRAFVVWFRGGRDRRGDAGGPIVTEFEPPKGLRPAELGLLVNERTADDDIAAILVDLAARGYIVISQKDGDDYEIRLANLDNGLAKYEWTLLDALFKDQADAVMVSHLRSLKFYRTTEKAQRQVREAVKSRKLFTADPNDVRSRFANSGWGAFGAAIVLVFILVTSLSIVGPLTPVIGDNGINAVLGITVVAAGLAVAGVLTAIAARWMPSRTAAGHSLYRRALGFRHFMDVADRSRQEFYEREGIFERYLPYAMVFGMVDRWAQVFETLSIPIIAPAYLHSSGDATFSAATFTSTLGTFSSGVSEGSSPPPSTGSGSGGSSFSSSSSSSSSSSFGGSSGSGTGGGGGGSW